MIEYAQSRKSAGEGSFLLEDNVQLKLQKNSLQGFLSKLNLLSVCGSLALQNNLACFYLPY